MGKMLLHLSHNFFYDEYLMSAMYYLMRTYLLT